MKRTSRKILLKWIMTSALCSACSVCSVWAGPLKGSTPAPVIAQPSNYNSAPDQGMSGYKVGGITCITVGAILGLIGVGAEFDGRDQIQKAKAYRAQYNNGMEYYSVINAYNSAYDKAQTDRTIRNVTYWMGGGLGVIGTFLLFIPSNPYHARLEVSPNALAFRSDF